ncbi:hypothetical protein FDECE_17738, partial [Fusarium decemcellulare]
MTELPVSGLCAGDFVSVAGPNIPSLRPGDRSGGRAAENVHLLGIHNLKSTDSNDPESNARGLPSRRGVEGPAVRPSEQYRTAGLIDGVFCVNGKPIKIRGANRHEHHPDHGRTVTYEFMKRDLMIMKRHNLNAIRTCHQPSDPRLYELADELGLWVLDEADLECHGFWSTGGNPASFISDNPAWKE